MEDCYGPWGNLLPGLLESKVPAHMWLRAVTGKDQDMWQYWAENPALEEQFSQAMTNWDNMVRPSRQSLYRPRGACCARLSLKCYTSNRTDHRVAKV